MLHLYLINFVYFPALILSTRIRIVFGKKKSQLENFLVIKFIKQDSMAFLSTKQRNSEREGPSPGINYKLTKKIYKQDCM